MVAAASAAAAAAAAATITEMMLLAGLARCVSFFFLYVRSTLPRKDTLAVAKTSDS